MRDSSPARTKLPQADKGQGHVNNLYNTTFWTLIQIGGLDAKEAEKELMGTLSSDKNEILFSRFGINYNNEPEIFKKGSVILRDYELAEPASDPIPELDVDSPSLLGDTRMNVRVNDGLSKTQEEKDRKRRGKARITVEHIDIIRDEFWLQRPWLLSGRPGKIPKEP
ncbi:MAG: tRNA-His guanylyltransferase [Sclerophora amabilis]|nr:MAG: tRNA-His guanylyltransferase [Sclerophora amabilis]